MVRLLLGMDNIFLLKREILSIRKWNCPVMTAELLCVPGFLKKESLSEQENIQIQLL
jgi:hypothetical protein